MEKIIRFDSDDDYGHPKFDHFYPYFSIDRLVIGDPFGS
jgi:hypothetical protein